MFPLVTKPIDRVTLWLATMGLRSNGSANGSRAEENSLTALERLSNDGDFFREPSAIPSLSRVARNIHNSPRCATFAFEFPSACPSPWQRNNAVGGKMFLSSPDPKSRPTVLVLHGWNHGGWQFLYYDAVCRWLASRGINSLYIELPYHGKRRLKGAGEPRNFLTDDLAQGARAVQQSVSDARQALRAMAADGFEDIGIWGISLGGWVGALMLGVEEKVKFAALMTPATRIDEMIRVLPFTESIRARLARDGVSLETLAAQMKFMLPAERRPLLPPSRILLMQSLHDQFVTPDSVEALWEKWQRPLLARYPQGHISILVSPRALSDLARFFQRRN